MTQQTALLVHELMDNPVTWKEVKPGEITNGYYHIALDATRYGMGPASYQSDGAERQVLEKAVAVWKEDIGYVAPQVPAALAPLPQREMPMLPDVMIRRAHEDFASAVSKSHKAFTVHGDAHVFGITILNALTALNTILRPMEQIEGKRRETPLL